MHPLGGAPLARGTLLQVTFVPDATEMQIRTLLARVDARIVEGPGALGVYTVSVPPEQADAALRELESARAVVASAARAPSR